MDRSVGLRLHDKAYIHNVAFQWNECLVDEKDEKDENKVRKELSLVGTPSTHLISILCSDETHHSR